jgi:hypothetical protein
MLSGSAGGGEQQATATLAERGGATARPYAGVVRRSTTPSRARRPARRAVPIRWTTGSLGAPGGTFALLPCPLSAATVEAVAAALLACPFAGLHRVISYLLSSGKTVRGGQSFGTVSPSPRKPQVQEESADRSA